MTDSKQGQNMIEVRKARKKEQLLKNLRGTPIIEIACKKTDIGRATYYRWHKEDPNFTSAADKALLEGSLLVNDMAEAQLISAIRDKNLSAITYWLRHHHPTYANKVELSGSITTSQELTPEQEALVQEALRLASLIPEEQKDEKPKHPSKPNS